MYNQVKTKGYYSTDTLHIRRCVTREAVTSEIVTGRCCGCDLLKHTLT